MWMVAAEVLPASVRAVGMGVAVVAFIISRWRLTKPLGCSLIFLHMTFIALTLLTNSIGGKQPVLLLLNTPGWSD